MYILIHEAIINTITDWALFFFPLFGLSMAMHKIAGWHQKTMHHALGLRAYMVIFGWPGTLVHELSHAFTGLLFGHKVESFKVNLLGAKDGKAGSVRLKHNPNSYYQKAGIFFIAIAPIFGCAAVISFAAAILAPALFNTPAFNLGTIWHCSDYIFALRDTLFLLFKNQLKLTSLFLYIVVSVGCGMRMSSTDMKKAVPGSLILLGLLLLFHLFRLSIGEKIYNPVAISDWILYVYTILIATLVLNLILIVLFYIIVKIRSILFS